MKFPHVYLFYMENNYVSCELIIKSCVILDTSFFTSYSMGGGGITQPHLHAVSPGRHFDAC